jgi:hypothetical protein
MNGEYNRYDTPLTPGSCWPDGTPVSNWSHAIATLKIGAGAVRASAAGSGHWTAQREPAPWSPLSASSSPS